MVFGTRVSAMRVVPALSEAELKSAMDRAEAQFKNRGIFTSKKKRQIKYLNSRIAYLEFMQDQVVGEKTILELRLQQNETEMQELVSKLRKFEEGVGVTTKEISALVKECEALLQQKKEQVPVRRVIIVEDDVEEMRHRLNSLTESLEVLFSGQPSNDAETQTAIPPPADSMKEYRDVASSTKSTRDIVKKLEMSEIVMNSYSTPEKCLELSEITITSYTAAEQAQKHKQYQRRELKDFTMTTLSPISEDDLDSAVPDLFAASQHNAIAEQPIGLQVALADSQNQVAHLKDEKQKTDRELQDTTMFLTVLSDQVEMQKQEICKLKAKAKK